MSRTFDPSSVEVVRGQGQALPPLHLRSTQGSAENFKFQTRRPVSSFSQFQDGGFQPRKNPYPRVQQRFTSGEELVSGPPLGDIMNISFDRKGPIQVPDEWTNALQSNVFNQIQSALSSLEQYPDHVLNPDTFEKLNEIELTRPSEKVVYQKPVVFENYPTHIVDPGLIKKSPVSLTNFSTLVGNKNGLRPVTTWKGEKLELPTPIVYTKAYMDKLAAMRDQHSNLVVNPSATSFSPSTWLNIRPDLVRNRQQNPSQQQDEIDIITIDNVLSTLNHAQHTPEVYTFEVKTSYNARDAVRSV